MKKRVVFLGSKPIGYDCFEFLIHQQQKLNFEIVGIRTQNRKEFDQEKDLSVLAQKNNIPVFSSLDEMPDCDFIYSVQHHELLKARHIKKASVIAVNLHLAPLPEYRGCNQFSFAILDEVESFGVTIHEINTKIDNGAILFEKRFPVSKKLWVHDLYELSIQKGFELFNESLQLLLSGNYSKIAQEDRIPEYGVKLHFRNEIQNLKVIDLNLEKKEIEKRIRATYMPGFEPPYCFIEGRKVFFQIEKT